MNIKPAIVQAFLCPEFRSRAMSLNCPFCHSTDIMIVEANIQQANSTLSNFSSPAALGALGTTVAKSLNLPPIVGGIAGTVLGGLFNSFTEQSTPPQQSLCFCHNCYQKFPTQYLN